MIELSTIRKDLKEIRYYYVRKSLFDDVVKRTGFVNDIKDKVYRYNEVMQKASPRLYDIYYSLYIKNHTQESLSEELGYTPEYIQVLNKKLLKFLQSAIKESA